MRIVRWLSMGLAFTGLASAQTQMPEQSPSTTQAQNMPKGEKFLMDNKAKPGVVTTASGLQYKILTPGKGPIPALTDLVTVDYEGKLVDGTVFDSSYQRGQPASFPVNGVIQGWQEALTKMPEGSTWEIYIPASLAYGKNGVPGAIGPDEVLIFKVNLIKIQK